MTDWAADSRPYEGKGIGMTRLREELIVRTAWLLAATSLLLGFVERLRVG